MTKQIAYRFWNQNSAPWYVSEVKGTGHPNADWGYVTDISKAIVLNTNQWKSFAKDMREVGSAAFALVQ